MAVRRAVLLVVGLVVLGLLADRLGLLADRSSGKRPGRWGQLREVAELITLYSREHRRGPQEPNDLAKYEQDGWFGFQAVKSGLIVIVPGVTMPGEGEGGETPNAVVAYEKNTPTNGGLVLLQNGEIKHMDAWAFRIKRSWPKNRIKTVTPGGQ